MEQEHLAWESVDGQLIDGGAIEWLIAILDVLDERSPGIREDIAKRLLSMSQRRQPISQERLDALRINVEVDRRDA